MDNKEQEGKEEKKALKPALKKSSRDEVLPQKKERTMHKPSSSSVNSKNSLVQTLEFKPKKEVQIQPEPQFNETNAPQPKP